MLRITIQRAEDDVVMKLEGCLAGPWVDELETCWRQARTADRGRVRVDLRNVCHVDAAGRELMTRMHRAGAAFVVSGCLMPEVVREVTETPGGDRSPQERTWERT
jgi:ABC-type transporter Mla MlaB component